MNIARLVVLVLTLWFALGLKPGFSAPDDYDDSQSHPLRVVAYLLHPAAFLVEWTVFRPFHWLVSGTEPQETLFGHKPHPPILAEPQPTYNFGASKKVAMTAMRGAESQPSKPATAQEFMAEKVSVVEVPVEKMVVKEVIKIVEMEKIIFPAVAFRSDSAELTDLGKGQVYLAAQRLRDKPELAVVIEGHADNVGSDEYNQKLGLRRAQTVIMELSGQGIDPGRMAAATLGEKKPLINQETEWARAVNRRVELHAK